MESQQAAKEKQTLKRKTDFEEKGKENRRGSNVSVYEREWLGTVYF